MADPPFKKVLVANRGEIACRVIRTCREMGIGTVAVYSEADKASMHTRMADEAYCIGPPPAAQSYLLGERILETAKKTGAQAIHPGYGFLSENADFADAVAAAGLTFLGPPGDAMRTMGDKTAARTAMQAAGVPIVPGTASPLKSAAEAEKTAETIGYPVLLKAAAGGGGKGMRVVASKEELASSFRAATSEATSAFGDGRVYVEKYVEQPRHIEFQIFADTHGNVIHLGERECSIQRRHQKVIEEAPSSLLDDAMRAEMGAAAVQAAKACGYVNAGTIEFLVDAGRNFYFLEMNTRLQVEHPVTEFITGLDLVRLQIEVAAGAKLPLTQEQVHLRGHAFECRIYAEDPEANFLPSTGTLARLVNPSGPDVRVDTGVEAGDEISIYYDPLIAKLVAGAADRPAAIARMRRALGEYRVVGVKTTIPFCDWVLAHPRFQQGDFDTHFVRDVFFPSPASQSLSQLDTLEKDAAAIAAALAYLDRNSATPEASEIAPQTASNWRRRGWKQ